MVVASHTKEVVSPIDVPLPRSIAVSPTSDIVTERIVHLPVVMVIREK